MARIACCLSTSILLVSTLFVVTATNDVACATFAAEQSASGATPDEDLELDEWDRDDKDVSSSLKEALQRYSNAAPDGRRTKQLAMDVLILATVTGDTTTVNQMKCDLLQRYPSSVEAAYVVTTFADGKKLREFLDAQFLKDISDVTKARSAVQVVRLVLPKYKKELFEDQGFALRLVRAAFLSDDRGLCNESRHVLKNNHARVASTACDDLVTPEQRFLELQDLLLNEDFQSLASDIRGLQRHLLTLMTPNERSGPQILRILGRNHLEAGELELALVQFESLKNLAIAEDDSKTRFQHGVCLARLRRSDEARTVLKSVAADSPWRTSADVLIRWMDQLDVTIDQHAQVLTEILGSYRDVNLDVFDLELGWHNRAGDHVLMTVGLDLIKNQVEIVATKNEIPLLGFKGLSTESIVYIKGEPAILRLPKIVFLPDVQLSNCRIDNTGFHGNTQINTGTSMNGLRKTFRELIHNEQLTSKGVMVLLMAQLVRAGNFPQPLEATERMRVLHLSAAEIDQPIVSESTLSIDAENRLKSATFDWKTMRFEIRRLILSQGHDHELAPGNWPTLPTRTLGENEFGAVMRLMGSAIQLMAGELKTTETAANPDSGSILK